MTERHIFDDRPGCSKLHCLDILDSREFFKSLAVLIKSTAVIFLVKTVRSTALVPQILLSFFFFAYSFFFFFLR